MRSAAKSRAWLGPLVAVLVCGTGPSAFAADAESAVIRIGVDPASEQGQTARLHAALDRAFGAGKWRVTSGFRSEAHENALRAMGAGAVPVGAISHHSMGSPSEPGAYDVVVAGMDQSRAAQVLREFEPGFSRILFEGAHGPEGPHLHIEVGDGTVHLRSKAAAKSDMATLIEAHTNYCNSIYERVVDNQRNSKLKGC
ncbi:MAG TPA: hypothetical protein VG407_15370 [Caulobacteraceae bacterium]|jgi:hypothetical protein|nr:hypothetical protein [Caulobacteraceae bacterium]